MNMENISREQIEKMSDNEINSLLSKCSVNDLINLNTKLFGENSSIIKSIKSWEESKSYSENKLKNMIIHVCENRIKNIKSDYEKTELEKRKKERNKPLPVKIANKIRQSLNKDGGKEMLSKNDVKEVNAIIHESMDNGVIDNETCEILTDLVETCSEQEGLTEVVLEMVEEFIKIDDEEIIEEQTKSISELKLDVYEACRMGEISVEDRDNYLAMLEAVEKDEQESEESEDEKEEKIEKLGEEKKKLETVADIDKNESKIKKIKKQLEEKKKDK